MIKVIIGEEDTVCLRNICAKLRKDQNIMIERECIDGNDLMLCITKILPDLILLNTRLPNLDLENVMAEVYKLNLPKMLIFDDIAYSSIDFSCLGIHGIIPRNIPEDLFIKAIYKVVVDNELWIDRKIASSIIEAFRNQNYQKDRLGSEWPDSIVTHREKEVVGLVAKGLSNKEIADAFCISEKTVKTHLTHIYQKFKFKNRRELRIYVNSGKKPDI